MGRYSYYVVREELRFFSKPNRKCTPPSGHRFGPIFYRLSRLTQLFNHDEMALFLRFGRLSRVLNSGPDFRKTSKLLINGSLLHLVIFVARFISKSKFLIGRILKLLSDWISMNPASGISCFFPNQAIKAIYPDFLTTFKLVIYERLKTWVLPDLFKCKFLFGRLSVIFYYCSKNSASRHQIFFSSKAVLEKE